MVPEFPPARAVSMSTAVQAIVFAPWGASPLSTQSHAFKEHRQAHGTAEQHCTHVLWTLAAALSWKHALADWLRQRLSYKGVAGPGMPRDMSNAKTQTRPTLSCGVVSARIALVYDEHGDQVSYDSCVF